MDPAEVDVSITPTKVVALLKIDNARRDDLEIHVEGHTVSICGSTGGVRFVRQFVVPADGLIDKGSAAYRQGVLTIEIPRKPQA